MSEQDSLSHPDQPGLESLRMRCGSCIPPADVVSCSACIRRGTICRYNNEADALEYVTPCAVRLVVFGALPTAGGPVVPIIKNHFVPSLYHHCCHGRCFSNNVLHLGMPFHHAGYGPSEDRFRPRQIMVHLRDRHQILRRPPRSVHSSSAHPWLCDFVTPTCLFKLTSKSRILSA